MEIEYNQRLNEMEPMLVETILTVFEKVTHVLAEDKKIWYYNWLMMYLVKRKLVKNSLSESHHQTINLCLITEKELMVLFRIRYI